MWLRCYPRGGGSHPPPPGKGCFSVKSRKQLVWLASRGKNFFFLYGKRGTRLALSLWLKEGGLLVCSETGAHRCFVSHRRLKKSFLGRALAEGRLYVDWSL